MLVGIVPMLKNAAQTKNSTSGCCRFYRTCCFEGKIGQNGDLSAILYEYQGHSVNLEVIHYPHPTLRHVSKPLKRVDRELRDMIAQMFELMYKYEGVGLAANQVDLPYRLFIANPTGDAKETSAEHVFINPVLHGGKGQVEGEEGCLSIPDVKGNVVRKERITVEAYNLAGEQFNGELNGLFARIAQHEVDHLDGVLFIDRLSPSQRVDISGNIEEFEIDFQSKRERGEMPTDEQIAARLAELERLRA